MKAVIRQTCASQDSDWATEENQVIDVIIPDALKETIRDAQKAFKILEPQKIRKLTYDIDFGELIGSEKYNQLQEQCRFDVETFSVMKSSYVYIYIQGKYDCDIYAEFAFDFETIEQIKREG